jgi:hypothetical protein
MPALSLTFLGTRGEIDIRSRLHRRHSSLLVCAGGPLVMIDRGADWLLLEKPGLGVDRGQCPAISQSARCDSAKGSIGQW